MTPKPQTRVIQNNSDSESKAFWYYSLYKPPFRAEIDQLNPIPYMFSGRRIEGVEGGIRHCMELGEFL